MMRTEFTEWIRKIIWIIFSGINNLNSALHLTNLLYSAREDCGCNTFLQYINDCNCTYLSVMCLYIYIYIHTVQK